jgi:dephospho-CoA kinase|tara:strand:+ start:615 stop:1205 length:591 start_codon:yes stop_codon:yes gene_type:complete
MTGGIGSGKSEATKIFEELSVPLIDLDDIAYRITQKDYPGYIEIIKYFGNKYLDKNKKIIRKNLKIDIFNSTKIKKKIESILHPIIFSECKEQIYKYKSEEYIVIVIPLLFETENYLELIDESLFIDCNEDIQFKRVSSRDKLDESLIKSIINSQLSRARKIKKADKIIENNLSKALFKDEIYQYHNELKLRIDRK